MVKPKVTPNQLDLWSNNVAYLYESLEGEIIRMIIKRLNRGATDITQWQSQMLSELHLYNADVTKLLAKTTNVAESQIKLMFEQTGTDIVVDVDKALPYPKKPMPNELDKVMSGYAAQSWSEINNHVNQTLISTAYGAGTAQLAYQNTLSQTSAMVNTGLYTLEQALEKSVSSLAQQGIKSTLIDKGGNAWNIDRYVRTVLKSTLGNTYDKVRKDRMADYDVHTVLVTSHAGAREKCSHIQANVVDLRRESEIPEGSKFKSIYDVDWGAEYGTAGGHRGVNCRHLHVPFIDGVNTNNQPKYDKELNDKVNKDRDTQRRIEREITKYKKNHMIAKELKSDNAGYWGMMVNRRQKAMRDHLKVNGEYLSRNYQREKVYTPLDTLLNGYNYKQG